MARAQLEQQVAHLNEQKAALEARIDKQQQAYDEELDALRERERQAAARVIALEHENATLESKLIQVAENNQLDSSIT
jgi:hypothetical protein